MPKHEQESPSLPEVKVATVETSAPEALSKLLALGQSSPPTLIDPETLVLGLRHLQQRIPEFIQLSIAEERAMARAAYLDPKFIQTGLHAGSVWADLKARIGRTIEDLRLEDEATRRWDDVIREARAAIKGIEGANLQRKHRLGQSILLIYSMLGILLRRPNPKTAHLRPYYEEMKRIYHATLKKARKRAKKEEDE